METRGRQVQGDLSLQSCLNGCANSGQREESGEAEQVRGRFCDEQEGNDP